MNLLRGRALHGHVSVGDVELDHVRTPDGEVVVGIRPEGLRPVGREYPGPVFEVGVEVVEPLGDEVLVHGSVAAQDGVAAQPDEGILAPDIEPGRASVIVRLPPEDRPATGSLLRVAPAPNAVRLFDPAGGRAIPDA